MIFKESAFEERYTAMWNSLVVPADTQIKKMLGSKAFFQLDTASCIQSINQYASTVKNILNNLIRQYDSFDDKNYVDEYIESTFKTLDSDFAKYRRVLGRRVNQDAAIELIDQLKQEFSASIMKHRQDAIKANELTDDSSIELFSLPLDSSFPSFNSYELTDNWGAESMPLGLTDSWGKESIPFESTNNWSKGFTPFEPTEDWENGFTPFAATYDWDAACTSGTLDNDCRTLSLVEQDDDIDIDTYFNPYPR